MNSNKDFPLGSDDAKLLSYVEKLTMQSKRAELLIKKGDLKLAEKQIAKIHHYSGIICKTLYTYNLTFN